MRKSLGNKRNEVCEDQRAEIARLYGELRDGEHVRVFDNEDFGYQRVTVERPLRLKVDLSEENRARFREACGKKDAPLAQTVDRVAAELGPGPHMNFTEFMRHLRRDAEQHNVRLPARRRQRLRRELAEKDQNAWPVVKKMDLPKADPLHGKYEAEVWGKLRVVRYAPDPELRDYENVPLKEDVEEYFKREVLPYVPDAWIDHEKTKVGYEINFNRYFYKYEPPRPLEEIEADLKEIEQEIADMLAEVTDE